jgi:plasmid stabilization system protein ParE
VKTPEVRVHDLKHTYSRRLRAAGVSFEDRQDLLGHKPGRITTHYSAAELHNLIEAANRVLAMKPSTQIKPISYLKAHTAEVIRKLDEQREALIITQNGEAKAAMQDVLDRISDVFQKLTELPEHSTYPKELSALGIHEFREVFFKPCRIIYRVERRTVYIYLIADGRRDMQTLLSRRLLNT